MNNTVLEINKTALLHNLSFFKNKLHKNTKIIAVVKAFAYGSDATIISKILAEQKIDYLAVAYTNEGISLRKAGINIPIIVLHAQPNNFKLLIKNCLAPNLYSFNSLNKFIKIAKQLKLTNFPVHIKFNTGLNRLGFLETDAQKVIAVIKQTNTIVIQSVFSHLAASEDLNEKLFTTKQITSFKKIKNLFETSFKTKPLFHILNTSGIINYSKAQFDMVRLGIGLLGFTNDKNTTQKLQNVLTLKSNISQIHTIKKGETIGYNRAFKTTKTTKTATIPIGHADGISRQLGNQNGYVTIHHKKAPIIGNVCMDMIMVDITKISCKEGDNVIIFDSQDKIIEISNTLNTIPYELLTMISQRVKRVVK